MLPFGSSTQMQINPWKREYTGSSQLLIPQCECLLSHPFPTSDRTLELDIGDKMPQRWKDLMKINCLFYSKFELGPILMAMGAN